MNPSPRIGKAPPRRILLACVCVALLGIAVLPSPSAAAGAAGKGTVAASVADASVEVGQGTEFRIDVVGDRAETPPAPPQVPGLNITFREQRYSSQIDFGTMSKTTTMTYVYDVEPTRPGRYQIPAVEITVGGASLRTLPVVLTVTDNGQGSTSKQVFVELVIPKKSVYLGETTPIEVRTYFAANVHGQLTGDLILNGEGFSVGKFLPQREVAGQTIDGASYQVASTRSMLTGLRIGTLSVGPVEVDPVVQLPRPRSRRRPYYNDPFDAFLNNGFPGMNLQPPQQIKLLSEPVPLEIKPLPPQGKPADFAGAVGQFRLDAEAEPRKAQTGDPVTVHLMLSGKGNFDRINAPVLDDEQGLRTYPPTSRFKPDDDVGLSGVKSFDQVVIADGPRTSLPGYHFSYFDPASGKYIVVETPPIAVRIEGGSLATPTPPPALAGTAPVASPTPRATPTPAPRRAEDILYIRPDAGPTLARSAFLPVYLQRGFWVAQGGGLMALLGCAAVGAMRTRARNEGFRQAALRQRRQAEIQRTLGSEDTGRREFYGAAIQMAQMLAAAATAQPDALPSALDICRARGLDAQTAASVEEMFRRHDELAYSGGSAAREPVPPEERQNILATLETLARSEKVL